MTGIERHWAEEEAAEQARLAALKTCEMKRSEKPKRSKSKRKT